jgi:hypothetical protein
VTRKGAPFRVVLSEKRKSPPCAPLKGPLAAKERTTKGFRGAIKRGDEAKSCKHCGPQPLGDIRTRVCKGYRILMSLCRACERKQAKVYRAQPGARATKQRYNIAHASDIKLFVQERMSRWRKQTPGSDLTVNYLIDLYHQQGGKCHYSGIALDFSTPHRHASPHSMSLDRIEPEKGYRCGNVAWCTYFVNTMKGPLCQTELLGLLRRIIDRCL